MVFMKNVNKLVTGRNYTNLCNLRTCEKVNIALCACLQRNCENRAQFCQKCRQLPKEFATCIYQSMPHCIIGTSNDSSVQSST